MSQPAISMFAREGLSQKREEAVLQRLRARPAARQSDQESGTHEREAEDIRQELEEEFSDATPSQIEALLQMRLAVEEMPRTEVEIEGRNIGYGGARKAGLSIDESHIIAAIFPDPHDDPSSFKSGFTVRSGPSGGRPGRPTRGTKAPARAEGLILERTGTASLDQLKESLAAGRPDAKRKEARQQLRDAIREIRAESLATATALAAVLGCSERTIERLAQ